MIESKETLTGNIASKQTISGGINVTTEKVLPELENLIVIPATKQQVFNHKNSDGYNEVIVESIPDEYIIPEGTLPITENKVYDVTPYARVSAEVYPTPNLQDKEVTPTKEIQNITSDDSYDGLKQVTVNAIPDEYIVPSGILEITENGTYDVKEYAEAVVNVEGGGGNNDNAHTELEYMGITGNTYYKLNTKLNSNSRVIAKFTRDLSTSTGLFGYCNYGTSNTDSFSIYLGPSSYNSGRMHAAYGAANKDLYFSSTATEIILDANKNVWSFTDFNGNEFKKLTHNTATFENKYNCTVGASIWGSSETGNLLYYKGNLYYFKVYQGDTLVHYLVPIEKPDGTITLYDKVNKTYLENLGADEPIAGPYIGGSDVEGNSTSLYLIKDGIEQTDITGGHAYTPIDSTSGYVEVQKDGYIELSCQLWGCVGWIPNNSFDFTKYTKICVDYEFPTKLPNNELYSNVWYGQFKINTFKGEWKEENISLLSDSLLSSTNEVISRRIQGRISSDPNATNHRLALLVYNIATSSNYANYPIRIYNLWLEE